MKYYETILYSLTLGIVCFLGARMLFGEPYIFIPGEEKNVWIEVAERDGGSFTIDTATSWIETSDGTSFVSETSAIISGNRIYAPVDGSGTDWAVGTEFHLFIRWGTDITDEIYINGVQIQVEEGI